MIEVKVAHLGLDRTTNTPVVILQEKEGERVLTIWIGPAEASAIAMELAGVKFARPLTHDLLKQLIVGLGARLNRVLITQVKENTYYAELDVRREADYVIVTASARSFLHHQVRSMVGSLKVVGEGRWGPVEMRNILDACDRSRCGMLAPAAGLYLTKVDYGV